MTDLERAKEALTTIDCTCALCRDGEVRTTQLRGIAPLLSWLEEGLSGWSVADRVVGAGAAWLYTLLHPAMVYAPVMSRRATAILTQYGVPYTCDEVAESILNRTGTGLCPMEEATADAADPQQALAAIRQKVQELRAMSGRSSPRCPSPCPPHKQRKPHKQRPGRMAGALLFRNVLPCCSRRGILTPGNTSRSGKIPLRKHTFP